MYNEINCKSGNLQIIVTKIKFYKETMLINQKIKINWDKWR